MRHRCFLTTLLLAGLTLVLCGPSLPAQTNGPLSVHPENPRYFADRSGKALLLTGSHTWPNLVDMGPSDPPPAFDFDAYLKWLQQHGHNFTRGWTWEPTKWDNTRMKNPEWRNGAHSVAPHPWGRTGPGLSLDGKPKFDLEEHNADYLARSTPRAELSSTGYCLAEPGVSYVVFAPEGGGLEVDLTAASSSFQGEWHNVASGMIAKADAVTGGAKRLLHPPFPGAAVLFLHCSTQP